MSKTSLTKADFRSKNQKDMSADGTNKIFLTVVDCNVLLHFQVAHLQTPLTWEALVPHLCQPLMDQTTPTMVRGPKSDVILKEVFFKIENVFSFFSECCYGYETQEGSPVDPGRTLEPCQLRRTCFFNGKTAR